MVIKMEIKGTHITLQCEDALHFCIQTDATTWVSNDCPPYMVHKQIGNIALQDAKKKETRKIHTGFGQGILMQLSEFTQSKIELTLSVIMEEATQQVYCSISADVEDEDIMEVYWPSPFSFSKQQDDWYTLLPLQQGLLIPNTWHNEVQKLPFQGQLCTSSAYMPWFSQIKEGDGYLAIATTPWDGAYQIEHPANGPYTHVSFRWLNSLRKIGYTRTVRYSFMSKATHVSICKAYQDYVKEIGVYTTLKEKEIRNPALKQLIGCAFVHKGIKTFVSEESDFFDPQAPNKNNHLVAFAQREQEVRRYQQLGVKKLYYHLDGWAQPGYDNAHPDYFPICEEAGGSTGLKSLQQSLNDAGYLLGLHDQYRDYYHQAPSYHDTMAVLDATHQIPSHKHWAGGKQSYLCSSIAPSFVKRNFQYLFDAGIYPQASYLDVFTCNEPDECDHPWHRVTRKESLAYREQCFAWLQSKGILASSEEANDWAIKHLIFSHYGPYESMMHAADTPSLGIDVPLFNLVYHACIILPWPMEKVKGQHDQMLFALLNGGLPYLEKDGAYPNTDGVFDDTYETLCLEEKVQRSGIVQALHEQVAYCDMINHEFLQDDILIQKTTFSNGTSVTIDLHTQTYSITSNESSH